MDFFTLFLIAGALLLMGLFADEFTVSSGAPLADVVQTAYSRATEMAFTPKLFFAQPGMTQMKEWDTKKGDPMPGNAVVFTIYDNLSAATTELSDEYSDVTRVPMGETQPTITLREYGNVVTPTSKLRVTSFDNIDLAIGRAVGENMGNSVDQIARAAWDAQTGASYVRYIGAGSKATIIAANILTAAEIRRAYNRLDRANVPLLAGGFYVAILHPDVVYDVRNEASASGGTWRAPKEYVDPSEIYNGEIGEYEGFRIVKTTNALLEADAGSNAVDVYSSYFAGYQAIGTAEGVKPEMRITGPFDNLGRTVNVGWYALAGWGEVRPESLHKVFSAASLGANT